jgi:hypothetical protein
MDTLNKLQGSCTRFFKDLVKNCDDNCDENDHVAYYLLEVTCM